MEAHLIATLVTDENYERAVVFLHIVVDKDGDPRV